VVEFGGGQKKKGARNVFAECARHSLSGADVLKTQCRLLRGTKRGGGYTGSVGGTVLTCTRNGKKGVWWGTKCLEKGGKKKAYDVQRKLWWLKWWWGNSSDDFGKTNKWGGKYNIGDKNSTRRNEEYSLTTQ